VFEKLTGVKGAFDTKIAYVMAKAKRNGQKQYVLAIADADGYNEQIILKSSWPLMSPAWSPDAKQLAYVSFEKGRPRVYIQELATGKRQLVSQEKGLNGAPSWSPDGRFLALTLSRDNNAEVYVMELASRKLNRITRNSAIDTEATWAPQGNVLCFTSDRGGRPQLYEVRINPQGERDSRPKRISFEGDYNSRPVYSPDGRYIAMVHGERGRYQIAVMDRDNGQLWIVADTKLGESPSFAPNSAMLIYASEVRNQGVLEAVTVEGRGRQRLGIQSGDVREPAWSPYLP
jgi:TolB protein